MVIGCKVNGPVFCILFVHYSFRISFMFFLGRLYDKNGNFGDPWWTEQSVRAFTEKAQCFVSEYSNFSINGRHVRLFLSLAGLPRKII